MSLMESSASGIAKLEKLVADMTCWEATLSEADWVMFRLRV